jgi:uncharacterized membrane protein
MKAIASIRNKIKKPSRSTVLFWAGSFVAVLGAVLPLIVPGAQSVLSILGVGGVVLAGSQKIVGDREQDRKFEQERRAREAAEQNVLDQTEGGKERLRRSRLLNTMKKNSQEQHS